LKLVVGSTRKIWDVSPDLILGVVIIYIPLVNLFGGELLSLISCSFLEFPVPPFQSGITFCDAQLGFPFKEYQFLLKSITHTEQEFLT
jgi:hypothetical protein